MVSYGVNWDSDAGRSGGEVFAVSSVREVETAHCRANGGIDDGVGNVDFSRRMIY